MFLVLSVCVLVLVLRGEAQDHQASLWRGNDRSGRCQYTFTVPSPSEASCPQLGASEVEGLKARLGVLEALLTQLTGKHTLSPGGHRDTGGHAELLEALNRAVGEKNRLQGEKERLDRELGGLQRRMEDMRRETERLRSRQCPPQTPVVQSSSSQQDRNPVRPAAETLESGQRGSTSCF
ncbi:myocilin [Austrofundulus limnaeus]|uniref:Myocilin n=1 Tax=Austrofundulus limnaeus TaxID=52670 RepID=A0A2I4CZG5_AUSLI|nr:PREDICTED: myocilin [Austrofundulus limnaeus]